MRDSTLSDDTLVAGMGAGDERAGVTFVAVTRRAFTGSPLECSATRRSPLAPPRPVPAVGCSSCVLWL